MIKKERKIPEPEKLNLVPIMDAVFIFIFFLLFSAQFVKMYEIESDAPLVSEVPSNQELEKDPLNLIIEIQKNKIVVKKGVDQKVLTQFDRSDVQLDNKMKELLIGLRKQYQNDNYVILAPNQDVAYEDIIHMVEVVQLLPKGMQELYLPSAKKNKRFSKIFSQVILEPLE